MPVTMTPARAVAGIAVFADDAPALAAAWLAVLGIELEQRVHDDGREHWIGDLGGVHVELKALRTATGDTTSDAVGDEARGTSRAELSFTVEDAGATFERALAEGWHAHEQPATHRWGTFCTVLDPEGNRIGLYTPPAQAREGGES